MNFHKSLEKYSILTSDIRKQPQTSLASLSKADRGLAMNNHWRELCTQICGKILGGPINFSFANS